MAGRTYYGQMRRKEVFETLLRESQHFIGYGLAGELVFGYCSVVAACFRGKCATGHLWAVWEITHAMPRSLATIVRGRHIGLDVVGYSPSRGWWSKSFVEMDGPYYYGCPRRYLKMVPPALFPANLEWRRDVYRYHAVRSKSHAQFNRIIDEAAADGITPDELFREDRPG